MSLLLSLFFSCLLLVNIIPTVTAATTTTIKTIPVRIPSNTPSGNIFLEGTLYLPYSTYDNKTKYSATVFVHGSGSSNRNESTPDYTFFNIDARPNWIKPNCGLTSLSFEPFYEIAMELALKAGMIVLTYDKRNCCRQQEYCKKCTIIPVVQQFSDSCYYACTPNAIPQKIDLNKYTLEDDMLDALNALNYLTTRNDVNVKKLTILGHSQGVNIVPKTASVFNQRQQKLLQKSLQNNKNIRQYNSEKQEEAAVVPQVTNIFLMNGFTRDWGDLFIEQYERSRLRYSTLQQICEKEDPSSPLINMAKNNIEFIDISLQQFRIFFPNFKKGDYPLNIAYNVGGYLTGYYLQSLYNYTGIETMKKLLMEGSLQQGGLPVICSLNSPTDLNLPSIDYSDLISILKSRQQNRTYTLVIDNLTHFDSPADLSTSRMTSKTLDYIRFCLTQD